MPQAPIPFGNTQASGLDELGGASPVAMNVIAESSGLIRRRPGLASFSSSPPLPSLDGMYETVGGKLYGVTRKNPAAGYPSRRIVTFNQTGSTFLSTTFASELSGDLRPVFAETESILAIAGGADIEKIVLATSVSSRLGGSPPKASHVIANASRLLANSVTDGERGRASYSGVAAGSSFAGFENWAGTAFSPGFFSAEARPDPIVALHENTNEVLVFGSSSLQVFAPDLTTDYAPVTTTEVGCVAPYSVVKTDQNFAWLDHFRRFVVSDGRSVTVISDQIQRTLAQMSTVSDGYGFRFVAGTLDALVWTFPTEKRTFVYQKQLGWGQWGGFSAGDPGSWQVFPPRVVIQSKTFNTYLAASDDGTLSSLSLETSRDTAGTINTYVITGMMNRDTENLKQCRAVRITLRRGETTGTDEPRLLLSWRDNLGPWEAPLAISLGAKGDYVSTIALYSLGTYRRRQWKMEMLGDETFALAKAEEDFEVLSN